jgi:hypothetical protein
VEGHKVASYAKSQFGDPQWPAAMLLLPARRYQFVVPDAFAAPQHEIRR